MPRIAVQCDRSIPGMNYTTTLRNTNNLNQYLGKVDYTISPKDTIFGDYQYANAPIVEPSYVPNVFGSSVHQKKCKLRD